MPRIGDAQQFTPQTDAIPQNAQPMQGQLPMQQQLPQQQAQPQELPPALVRTILRTDVQPRWHYCQADGGMILDRSPSRT